MFCQISLDGYTVGQFDKPESTEKAKLWRQKKSTLTHRTEVRGLLKCISQPNVWLKHTNLPRHDEDADEGDDEGGDEDGDEGGDEGDDDDSAQVSARPATSRLHLPGLGPVSSPPSHRSFPIIIIVIVIV